MCDTRESSYRRCSGSRSQRSASGTLWNSPTGVQSPYVPIFRLPLSAFFLLSQFSSAPRSFFRPLPAISTSIFSFRWGRQKVSWFHGYPLRSVSLRFSIDSDFLRLLLPPLVLWLTLHNLVHRSRTGAPADSVVVCRIHLNERKREWTAYRGSIRSLSSHNSVHSIDSIVKLWNRLTQVQRPVARESSLESYECRMFHTRPRNSIKRSRILRTHPHSFNIRLYPDYLNQLMSFFYFITFISDIDQSKIDRYKSESPAVGKPGQAVFF